MVNEIAELLIRHRAIEFGEFTLASGAKSSYYIDVKTANTDPLLLAPIAESIAARCDFDVVAGVAVGAVPLAVATSLVSGRPYAIIRKEVKDHGKAGNIIGDVKGKDVLLVEDVTTSGGSVIYGIEALRAAGAIVTKVISVVDREAGATEKLKAIGVKLTPLVSVSDIVRE